MVDWKGKANPLVEAVREISITGSGRELSPEEKELEEMRGERVADSWEEDPRNPANRKDANRVVTLPDGDTVPAWLVEGDTAAADQNRAGSYEALLKGWGGDTGKAAFGTELLKE